MPWQGLVYTLNHTITISSSIACAEGRRSVFFPMSKPLVSGCLATPEGIPEPTYCPIDFYGRINCEKLAFCHA